MYGHLSTCPSQCVCEGKHEAGVHKELFRMQLQESKDREENIKGQERRKEEEEI